MRDVPTASARRGRPGASGATTPATSPAVTKTLSTRIASTARSSSSPTSPFATSPCSRLAEVAAQVVVLDHHLTAQDHFQSDPGVENAMLERGHVVHFDSSHSGAVLSWNHFHPGEPPPDLLLYVEDQDLWNWKLPRSEEVNAAIGSYPREFERLEPAGRTPDRGAGGRRDPHRPRQPGRGGARAQERPSRSPSEASASKP